MPVVRKSLILPYHTRELFDLVCDVESYPNFIDWVKTLNIEQQNQNQTVWNARARTTVAFTGIVQKFSTNIIADQQKLTIDVSLVDGPFEHLHNTWNFDPSQNGSTTRFLIDFKFKNHLLRALSLIHADHAGRILASKFTDEAKRRYGNNNLS